MSNKLKLDSSAVQSYLGILQDIITRMANNSSNCKNWCITLVSAILVIIADKNQPNYALIALIPVVLFLFLDAYYLGLEKGFRNSYNHFVHKLKKNTATTTDLFVVTPPVVFATFLQYLGITTFTLHLSLLHNFGWNNRFSSSSHFQVLNYLICGFCISALTLITIR